MTDLNLDHKCEIWRCDRGHLVPVIEGMTPMGCGERFGAGICRAWVRNKIKGWWLVPFTDPFPECQT